MLIICVLGYAKGIPFTLIFGTYTYKLAEDGMDLADIGNFGLAGLPFAIKFLWSPLVDGFKIPFLNNLGQRKSWLILGQILLASSIILFGVINPKDKLEVLFYLAIIISFISATYDIAYDAIRIAILDDDEQGAGVGASIVGYRIGVLTSGGLSLILAEMFSWQIAFIVISASLFLTVIASLFIKEIETETRQSIAFLEWLNIYIKNPLYQFVSKHKNWLYIIIFIVLYKIGDALLGKMINPFYEQTGFTKIQIAEVTKFFGFAMTIIGGLIGGWAVHKIGIYKSLLYFGIIQAASNLSFILLVDGGGNIPLLTFVIAFENISGAMGTAAFVAYMSMLCGKTNIATQFALFSSLESLGRWATNSPSGYLVDAKNGFGLSWEYYFIITFLISIPALMLLPKLKLRKLVTETS